MKSTHVKTFSWLDLSGRHPIDWEFTAESRAGYPGAQLFSPWLGPEDENGGRLMITMLRHPNGSGGSIEQWFTRNVIDTGIDQKVAQTREFAGAPGYWLVPKQGYEDLDLVIYAEFADTIYQFRIIGLETETRLAPHLPLTAVMQSLRFGRGGVPVDSKAS